MISQTHKEKQEHQLQNYINDVNQKIAEYYNNRDLEVEEIKNKYYRRKLIIKKFEDFEGKRIKAREEFNALKDIFGYNEVKKKVIEVKPIG